MLLAVDALSHSFYAPHDLLVRLKLELELALLWGKLQRRLLISLLLFKSDHHPAEAWEVRAALVRGGRPCLLGCLPNLLGGPYVTDCWRVTIALGRINSLIKVVIASLHSPDDVFLFARPRSFVFVRIALEAASSQFL